ncbi:aspartate 1-decarboxylase [Gemmatimonadota bacterium]
MLLTLLKSKIQRARVTRTELYYQGSLTLDPALIRAAGMYAGEMVQVVNLNNGTRLETYIIQGESPGNGEVVLNGPAARLGYVGDEVIILTYAQMTAEEAAGHEPIVVMVDADNQPVEA